MKIIYEALRGSHAHGLAGPDSDKDYFRIVIPPPEAIIGLDEMKGSQRIDGEEDVRTITLKEFLRAVDHGRSTELELLCAPVRCILNITQEGRTLLLNRNRLLSRRLFKPLMGFASGQVKRAMKGNKDRFDPKLGYDPKSMVHAFRSMWQAKTLKERACLPLEVEPHIASFLRRVKEGCYPASEILELFEGYEREAKDTDIQWDIPDAPDRDWMQSFLMLTYRNHIRQNS